MIARIRQLHSCVIEAKQKMRLLLLREKARDVGARGVVFHIVVGRVDVIPLPVHLHSRPHMAAPFDAARFHACCLEELNVGGVIALASDRHARERPIDAHVSERVIIADVVDDPIMQRKRRLIVVHVSVGQALCNDFSGFFIRVDKTIASNFDLEGEPHIARRLRVAHHKLVLITPGTDELIAQHIGIPEGLGRRESGVVYPDIGVLSVILRTFADRPRALRHDLSSSGNTPYTLLDLIRCRPRT